jgi:UDP-N-acetylmuramate--alanine ligase
VTRAADDVGRGLAAARPARAIAAGERIHVVGVAGAGASAAALLAHHAGARVSGCDAGGPSPYTVALEGLGLPMEWQHDAAHVERPTDEAPQRLAVTKALTAIDPGHRELAVARKRAIPIEPWQQLVADVAASTDQRLVAVAGTHGKSTTSGWLVHLLVTAERDPTAFVGALLDGRLTGSLPATGRWGRGDAFIVEADEYAGNFDPYRPSLALLLNAEWDHPDVFADQDAVESAFEAWLRTAVESSRQPTLVANMDDDGVARICRELDDWPGSVIGVGFDERRPSLIQARREQSGTGGTVLVLDRPDRPPLSAEVGLPGRHNAANALVVAGAAHVLGVDDQALLASLAEFPGVGRRLELKGEASGVTVLDDYGHHPTAIERTLEAVRERYPSRRVWAVYEPLTYHRTAHMLERFAQVLARADAVAVADIWAGRDPDTTVTSSAALAAAVRAAGGPPAQATGSVEATADYLAGVVEAGDVVLVMGGGRSYVIAERLVELLSPAV